MALTQLITTIETSNNSVGVNNINGTTGGISLGTNQNVGIGIADAVAGLHLGAGVVPAVYLTDTTGAPAVPAASGGDGIFSVIGGVPTFTNASGPQTLLSVLNTAIGVGTLVAGTVDITPTVAVTPSSTVLLTRTAITGDVTTVGTLNVIANSGTFTVNSTVATDTGSFNYLIIN